MNDRCYSHAWTTRHNLSITTQTDRARRSVARILSSAWRTPGSPWPEKLRIFICALAESDINAAYYALIAWSRYGHSRHMGCRSYPYMTIAFGRSQSAISPPAHRSRPTEVTTYTDASRPAVFRHGRGILPKVNPFVFMRCQPDVNRGRPGHSIFITSISRNRVMPALDSLPLHQSDR